MERIIVAAISIGLLASGSWGQVRPREVADEDVDRVTGEIVRYLYARQNGKSGLWPHYHHQMVPLGGPSALALFALLEAGEHPSEKGMKLGLDALVKLDTNNLYVIAVRTMVLAQAVRKVDEPLYRDRLKKDVAWLTKNATQHGAWGYSGPERNGDNSCSQFALLALWEADRAGIEVSSGLIRRAESVWAKRHQDDGGWTYAGIPNLEAKSTVPMTAAALASLFICRDISSTASGPYKHQEHLDKGWEFLIARLPPKYIENGYLAFCVQRVGMTTGRKFLGKMDWFQAGAKVLCEPTPYGRPFRGTYGPDIRAAFELIFLARGRIPLTYNKLQHGAAEDWNFHNRDVPRFTEYMRRNFEQRMRWQVVKITDDVQILLDAPVLLVSGVRALELDEQQWAKLREYTLRGGTLLFIPSNRSKAFLESAKAGLQQLYQNQRGLVQEYYQWEQLPADHPVYSAKHEIRRGDRVAPLWGVSDGTRLLAILCERDIAAGWQRYSRTRSGRIDHELGANFFFYATGGNPMRSRMRPVFAGIGRVVRHHIKVAWLKHEGNWCSQPHALKYVSEKLTAENRAAIDLTVGVPIAPQALKGYHVLWMTGSRKFALSEQELAALRAYCNAGGTLVVNAVAGSQEFHESARTMFDDLFAGQGVGMGFVGPGCPLVTGKCGDFRGPNLTDKKLRRTLAWQKLQPKAPDLMLQMYQKGSRTVAIYAEYGIHDTLDGHAGYGAMSYLPPAARDIAANIVLHAYVSSLEAAAAASQPVATTAPTAQED